MRNEAKQIDKKTSAANLFEAIKSGDEASFAQYYEETIDRLIYHVQAVTQDMEDARNIAHDSFVKLWQQREGIEQIDGFLFTAATNAALNARKKKIVQSKYNNEQQYLQEVTDHSADARILALETELRIKQTIRNMPTRRRQVFELSREDNLTYNEIAERMELSYNTVKNYMATALEEIRSAIILISILVVSIFR